MLGPHLLLYQYDTLSSMVVGVTASSLLKSAIISVMLMFWQSLCLSIRLQTCCTHEPQGLISLTQFRWQLVAEQNQVML